MKKKNAGWMVGVVALAVAGAWYLNKGDGAHADNGQGGKGPGGKGGMPPTTVNVVVPQRQDVGVELSANGTVTPVRTVDLHPQTTATIRQVHIREGQFVKEGQVMFSLDDRADRANVARAEAQVAQNRATLADLERQYKRSQELAAQNFLSQSAVDSLKSQVEAARALVASNAAAARASQVSASYTTIRAPMSGRVGAIDIHPGALVQPATSLTTITQLDPIDVSFNMPESSLGALLTAQRAGKVAVQASTGPAAKPVTGELKFVDNAVDPAAGTIRVKAQFANPDSMLWPGQYVTTRVTTQVIRDAVVIPQNAIITSTQGTFVYVVGEGNEAKQVKVARLHGFGEYAAVTGLLGTEKVITEGKQNLRPGGKVRPAGAKPQDAAASNAAMPAAQKGDKA
ncbi:MAG: efflux RND transporter periplasmic adaptor subunit [Janthinobacterium lividum]